MFRRNFCRLADAPTGAVANSTLPAGNPRSFTWYRQGVVIRRLGCYKNRWEEGGRAVNASQLVTDRQMFHCVDNTNVKQFQVIRQTAERMAHLYTVPCVTKRVAVMRFKSGRELMNRQQIEPGVVYWAVVFSRRSNIRRHSGLQLQFDKNTGIIIDDKMQPVGTRVMYCTGRHINHKFHLKAAVLANYFI